MSVRGQSQGILDFVNGGRILLCLNDTCSLPCAFVICKFKTMFVPELLTRVSLIKAVSCLL